MSTCDLLIIRHAKSREPDGAVADFDRPLNQRGVDDSTLMARIFSERLPRPDRILCSPARRSRDTAAFLVPGLIDPRRVDYPPELYLAPASTLLDWIRATPASSRTIMLIGHNPGLTELVNLLDGTDGPGLDNLPTLGAVHLTSSLSWAEWGARSAQRTALVVPRTFRQRTPNAG